MNAYERMIDLISHESANGDKRGWDQEQVILRIREIEIDHWADPDYPDMTILSYAECQRIAEAVLA